MAANAPETIADVKPGDMLSAAVVARLLGFSPDTIYSWAATGRIKAVRYPSRSVRVPGFEVLRLVGDLVPPPVVPRETQAERQKRADAIVAGFKRIKARK